MTTPARIVVTVDASALRPISTAGGPTGVGRWTLEALRALSCERPEWRLRLLVVGRDGFSVDPRQIGPNAETGRITASVRWQRRLLYLDAWPSLEKVDASANAMLGPAYVTWRTRRTPTIPVIHDLTYVRYPQFVSRRHLLFLRRVVPRAVRRAALIVAVSETMKGEICEHFHLQPEGVAVVPNACDDRFARPGHERPKGLPSRYFLSLGTLEPRKNISATLRAYRSLRRREKDLPPLVVVGGRGWKPRAMGNDFERLLTEEGVTYLEFVEDSHLPAVYAGALALVFPSFYEGFGLPVLEAMTAGCPVITSDRGALREVAGGAALYADPANEEELAQRMAAVLHDDELRHVMAAAGLKRAGRYSWHRSGEALAQAIERVVQSAADVR